MILNHTGISVILLIVLEKEIKIKSLYYLGKNQVTSDAVCVQDAGGPAVQLELVETEKYQDPRWVQVAIVHGSIDKCDNSHFSSIFVRLDEPDVLRWIYLMLFPDRVNEIDIDDSQDDDY